MESSRPWACRAAGAATGALRVLVAAAACAASGCNPDGGDAAKADRKGKAVVMAVMTDSYPYSYLDDSGRICGIDIDIAKDAAARLGRPLKIKIVPFGDLLPTVRDGRADMAGSGLTITEGRLRDVDFSDPYAEEGGAFLYRSGEREPTMIRAESMRIGTVASMTHDFYLTRHGIDPIRYRCLELADSDLLGGKLDAILRDRPSAKAAADASGGRLAVSRLVTREFFGIALRKGFADLKDAVNAAIAERKKAR